MKKLLLILSIVLVSSMHCLAQNGNGFDFGAKTGVTISDFTSSAGEARPGFKIGAFTGYNIERFGFEFGAYYAQQGANNVLIEGFDRYDYAMDYINLQLFGKYQIFNGWRIYVGPQFGFLVNSTKQGKLENSQRESIDYINKFDIGITGGVGYTFRCGLDLSASYTHGLKNLFLNNNKAYNTTFNISVGWVF